MTVSRDHYYRLASEVPQERIEAATALLSELQAANLKEEWDYAMNRLIKGLTSTRQSAKVGFSMALIEVLSVLVKDSKNDLTVLGYFKQLLELTETKSSMKGKEERAILFGRLFGLQVILNSGLLLDSEEFVSLSELREFCRILIELSTIKSWLRESTIFTLFTFFSEYQAKVSTYNRELSVWILQKLNDAGLNLTTEGMSIYLSIPKGNRKAFSLEVENPQANWKNGDPLSKGNLPLLTKVLKDVEVVEEEKGDSEGNKNNKPKQKSNWNPRIHFVWDLIVRDFLIESGPLDDQIEEEEVGKKRKKHSKEETSKKKSKKNTVGEDLSLSLQEFWKVIVDESLFSEKSSHERKFWGFEIFGKFLKAVQRKQEIYHLFTPNLMRCLINQSSQSNRFLNKISIQTLNTIVEVAKREPTKAPIILSCLLDESHGGCWNFDLITKSKCIDEVLSGPEDESGDIFNEFRKILISKYFSVIKDVSEDIDDLDEEKEGAEEPNSSVPLKYPYDNVQKWCLDKLLHLIRSHKHLLKDGAHSKWLEEIFQLLIKNAFFKLKDTGRSPISLNIKNLSSERLTSILSDVITFKNENDEPWPLFCIDFIREIEENHEDYELVAEFDESLIESRNEILDILSTIKKSIRKSKKRASKKSKSKSDIGVDQLYCFQLLFSMVLIQFYMADEEAVSVLEELKVCYEDITNKGESEEGEEVDSSQVLTEIILSFVARKSNLLKKISMIIWESFLCAKNEEGKLRITENSLALLYDILESRENKEGLEKVFEGQGEYEEENAEKEEGEDDEEEEEEEEEDDDEDAEDSNSDSDSDSDSVDPDSTVDKVERETSAKLSEALGIPSSGEVKFEDLSDFEGDEEDSYESDSMDDEQMMEIDEQLSKIFKERRDALSSVVTGSKRKTEVIDAKEQMIFFKNRVLDLLEQFNKHQPSSYLNLTMIKPIITLIGLTLDKNVGTKAHKLLKFKISKTKVSKDQFSENFDSEEDGEVFKKSLLEMIQWLHSTASRSSSNQAHSMACNQACIILSKNLIGIDDTYLDQVIEIYTSSLKEWAINKKSKIQASMFFDFINWLNSKRENKQ
ncbi:rDNA transcriptional regulator Pol5p [[Candida] railenensis]|uniref:rDNA transcriptional regulator Pol5p n=1 Tax=[Candida] railenensis TaxID=45579 RepID=A0A9P0VWT3_9ASCO|nr:rDNA transcriptional regulator Pol5p [[Candida] railenensis]